MKNAGIKKQGSPYSDAECEAIILKLQAMLDQDKEVINDQEFMEKVKNCEYCLEQVEIEKSLKDLVKDKLKSMMVSANLMQSIREKLHFLKG